ncbi:MAG TPA: fatty acid--CoA ligase family protein [Candidatus Dormibacteraeota bacterium]|nr:fatty acid--CoA ligase family protein [Candidatus Dormibacteraeota bacterium]
MLYELWLETVRTHPREVALWELSSGRTWRFLELLEEAERQKFEPGCCSYPQGHSAEFIMAVLRAWRVGSLVCPLEPEQKPPRVPRPPRHCCHLKITSASSGRPSLIAFTGEQLRADVQNICSTMGLRREWPNLGAISLAHSYGFSSLVLPLLLEGIPLALAPSPLPEVIRKAADGFPSLTLAAVPALWRAWHDASCIPRSVRLAISAGSPLSLELEQSVFSKHGLKIHNFYGASECGGIAYDDSTVPRTEDAFVGRPMNNVRLGLGPDQCLIVHSQAVGETYWPEGDGRLGSGNFQTNDIAELRSNGVCLRGRLGDRINVAGRKIAPETIEQALRAHPKVDACLVFGSPVPNGERNEMIVACLVSDATAEELKHFLLERLPAWQVPRDWWFVESLPSNQRGKISRAEWAGRYQKKTSGPRAS